MDGQGASRLWPGPGSGPSDWSLPMAVSTHSGDDPWRGSWDDRSAEQGRGDMALASGDARRSGASHGCRCSDNTKEIPPRRDRGAGGIRQAERPLHLLGRASAAVWEPPVPPSITKYCGPRGHPHLPRCLFKRDFGSGRNRGFSEEEAACADGAPDPWSLILRLTGQRWSQEFGPVAKLWRLTKD